ERVHHVQRRRMRQVALDDAARQRSVLAPLDVDGWLAAIAPIGVQHRPMPVRPQVSRRFRDRIIADPDFFLVARFGPWHPLAIYVPRPVENVCDDWAAGMHDGDDALEREWLVALDVQHRSQLSRERYSRRVGRRWDDGWDGRNARHAVARTRERERNECRD